MSFTLLGLTPLIAVFDMPRSLAFYRDLLGFEVVFASPKVDTMEGRFSHWMSLRYDPVEIMLNTQYDSDERPEHPVEMGETVRGVRFYIGCSDIDMAYQHLTQRGLKADPPTLAPYGLKLFQVKDPDDSLIIFQEVRSSRPLESQA